MNSVELISQPSIYFRISRVLSSFFSGLSFVVLVIWLLRGLFNLESYGNEIILVSILFFSLSQYVKWKVDGIASLITEIFSKLGNIALFSFLVILIFSFLGLSKPFTDYTWQLLIAGIILKLASFTLYGLRYHDLKLKIERSALHITSFTIKPNDFSSCVGEGGDVVIVKRGGKKIGFLFFGNLNIDINNELGSLKLKLRGPMMLHSPLLRIRGSQVKVSNELLNKAQSLLTMVPRFKRSNEYVHLPFITVESDEFGERVNVGPISVESGFGVEEVEIWPFIRVSSSAKDPRALLFIYSNDPKSTVRIGKEELSIILGDDHFNFSRKGIKIRYLGYEFEVFPREMRISAPEFKLAVKENKVIFSHGGKSYSISSSELASELLKTLEKKIIEQINENESIIYFDPVIIISILKDVIEKYGA
ncbi:MAG TPA: hypothetical protein VKU94_06820 [Geobacterales bacterium]|nr:hypothetical protein [Geobacterales bacterium]